MEDPWLIRVGRQLRSLSHATNLFGGNAVARNTRELEDHVGNATLHIVTWAADIQDAVSYDSLYSVLIQLLTMLMLACKYKP